jgi:hypothetical protein
MAKISWMLIVLLLSTTCTFAQGTSIGSAAAVAPNGTAGGTLGNPVIDHFWMITTASNGYLRVQTTSDIGIDVDMTLFDINGISAIQFDGRIGTLSEVYAFLKPGTYYVQVHRWTGTIGSYSMTTSFIAPSRTTDIEPNDVWSSALVLTPSGSATGNLGYFGNGATDLDDFWKITTTEDGWLRVQVQSDSLDARRDDYVDLDVTLFDVNGTASLVFDGRTGSFSQVSGFLRPGTYYVDVRKWHGRAGSYQIKAEFFAPPLSNDVEGNDSPTTATPMLVNATVTGHLGYFSNNNTDMDDYWKFVVPSDGKVVAQVTSDSLDRSGLAFDLDLSIFDINGISNLSYDGEHGQFSQITLFLRPGTFLAQVHRWQGNGGSYSLKIIHTPPVRTIDPEPNDWFGSASNLTFNVPATGHLGYFSNGSTDIYDCWKLVAPATDSIYVHVWSDTTIDLDITAYGPDTTSSLLYDGRYGTYSRVGIKASAGATYCFKLNRWSGSAGSYWITASRASTTVGVEKNATVEVIPQELLLEQNFPNPFNPTTSIQYGLPALQRVRITIFSLLGQEIADLVDADQSPGSYRVVWNGKDRQGKQMPSGTYLIRLQAGNTQLVRKAIMLR